VKFLCTRNYFIGSSTRTRWTKGKYYEGRQAEEFERRHGIAYYIKSNDNGPEGKIEYMVKTKDYSTYFKSLEDVREEKLNKILDVGDSDDDLVSRNTGTGI
jgi:hypothetical protein